MKNSNSLYILAIAIVFGLLTSPNFRWHYNFHSNAELISSGITCLLCAIAIAARK